METVVGKHGRTVIPSSIRARRQIAPGDRLMWIDDGRMIHVIQVPADPIEALGDSARGEPLLERLLEERRRERQAEESGGPE